LDADPEAVARAARRLARFGPRFLGVRSRFSGIRGVCEARDFGPVAGIVMDLGLSSFQLEDAQRGFSFRGDGPLDMRFDPDEGVTAEDLVNGLSEAELVRLLRTYGEERAAGRVARALVRRRGREPFRRTADLAAVVAAAAGGRRGRLHPATRAFQALRMAVNREEEELRTGLLEGLRALAPGGRFAVIAFHSVEDRIVKRFFAAHIGREEALEAGGARWAGEHPRMHRITRKAVRPSPEETADNPRARSARLRVAEKAE
jgi:16S rRNA (cytosine1402-N4)-methyltransferase